MRSFINGFRDPIWWAVIATFGVSWIVYKNGDPETALVIAFVGIGLEVLRRIRIMVHNSRVFKAEAARLRAEREQ